MNHLGFNCPLRFSGKDEAHGKALLGSGRGLAIVLTTTSQFTGSRLLRPAAIPPHALLARRKGRKVEWKHSASSNADSRTALN
jgi:hypothetical protein